MSAVHAFFHTNRRLRPPPASTELVHHSGWWPDSHNMHPFEKGHKQSRFKREEFPYHARFAAHQAFKYQWLAGLTGLARPSTEAARLGAIPSGGANFPEPWLLLDTDVIIQCSAAELRERFARLGSPLVIGGEFQWWPKRDKTFDPWSPQPPPYIRYPNSGMLAGTRAGFAALEASFQAMPRYPCCAKFSKGKSTGTCHIDDQHCLQSALLLSRNASHSAATDPPALEWTIDANASLFLNLLGVSDAELVRRNGRCVYTATGTSPCVMHSNGKMAKPKMAHVFRCMPESAWVVPAGNKATAGANLTAALLFPNTH